MSRNPNIFANHVGADAFVRPVERSSTVTHTGAPLLAALARGGVFLSIFLALLLALSACNSKSSQPAASKRFAFKGKVVSVDKQNQSAVIDAEAIPGFMDAMAMDYKFKPASTVNQLYAGDSITADIVVMQPGSSNENASPDYWLENVKVTSHSAPSSPTSSLHEPIPGQDVPDFSFTNQSGKHISLRQYRGKVLFVTFIYTRCPFPDYCPRMSSSFSEIYRQIDSNHALASAHLLSLSFDPAYDKPRVLRDYAFSVAHTHDPALFRRWEFAVPSPADLPKVADFFALTVKPEGGLITHTLSTAVVGPNGKIVSWYHGSDWQVSDLIKDATGVAAAKS